MDDDFEKLRAETIAKCAPPTYMTDNRFAYKMDLTGKPTEDEMKIINFAPTYDKWCLYCDRKDCISRCSVCKFVYFCNKECQRAAWPIHKKHCGRNLFILCIYCGSKNTTMKCPHCPVKYCSDNCRNIIEGTHLIIDCKTFSSVMGGGK